MRPYEEAVLWVAEHAPDASTAPLMLIAYVYGVPGPRVADDYRTAREVSFRMRVPQPHEREVHVRGWREHPRRHMLICERHGCRNPAGPHEGDPK